MKDYMDIGLPEKLQLETFSDYIHISRKWFGLQFIILTLFTLFWNGFLIHTYLLMGDEASLTMKSMPLLHAAVGIIMAYYVLAGWLNTTNIFVSRESLEINHKPLPWLGNKKLKSADLKQLYTKEKVSRKNNSNHVTYEVHAILHNGKNIKLLSGLESSEQGLYIEQEIEKYLNIENTPVRGEVG